MSPKVRVGHFSPDAPSVDIYVDGEEAFSDLEFRDVSETADLDRGKHTVEVRASGSSDSVLEMDVDLEKNMMYTVLATGILEDDDLKLEIIADKM